MPICLLAHSACVRRRAIESNGATSTPQSFLAGTWRGTLTIQPNPTGTATRPAGQRCGDVDIRGRTPDEPPNIPSDDSI